MKIEANFLAEPADLRELMSGLCTARDIARSSALQPYTGREIAPSTSDSAELERFFRDGLISSWHQSGTARMGRDQLSVVDGRLRVHGVEGLRVADASVLPRVTSGNLMAPCVVIGEQAAAFLRKDS